MKDFNLETKLGLPNKHCCPKKLPGIFITRGATQKLYFSYADKGTNYQLTNFAQVTFVIKEDGQEPVSYKLYDEDGGQNTKFEVDDANKQIILDLTSQETADFYATTDDTLMEFEVAVKFIDTAGGDVIIEAQPYIQTTDSLYAESLE